MAPSGGGRIRLIPATVPEAEELEEKDRLKLPVQDRVFELCRIASMYLFMTRVTFVAEITDLPDRSLGSKKSIAKGCSRLRAVKR